jgi:large repetitive protein
MDGVCVEQMADLSLTKTADHTNTHQLNEQVVFTITLQNSGPDTATGIQVTDVMPQLLSFDSVDAPDGTTYDSTTNVWSVDMLAKDAQATLELTTFVNQCRPAAPQNNIAEVTKSDQKDPDSTPNNNNASEDDRDVVSVSFGCN